MASKVLTMKVTIKELSGCFVPELKYSVSGSVSEQGYCFGFGIPLSAEEFTPENVSRIIASNCELKKWGIIDEVRIVPKIIEDYRVRQMRLF